MTDKPPLDMEAIGAFLEKMFEVKPGKNDKLMYVRNDESFRSWVREHPELAKKVAGYMDMETGEFTPITEEQLEELTDGR